MKIFIDTEFTDLVDMDLISIALVCGKEHLYLERSDYDVALVSDFTREAVLPQLGKVPAMTFNEMSHRAKDWLNQYKEQEPVICFDYVGDYALLKELLGVWPAWLKSASIRREINKLFFEEFYLKNKVPRHHALHDARANAYAFRQRDY